MRDLPNILTFIRIGLIPILLIVLYLEIPLGNWLAAVLFAIASLTDFFDGMLARHYDAQTSLGRILDPIADKLLVASLLMMMVYFEKAPLIPALLILCREIIVSGLREYLAEFKVSVPVSRLAKIKTAIQFIAIFILLVGNEGLGTRYVQMIGDIMIWVAAILTIFTGYEYFHEGFNKIPAKGEQETSA